MKPIVSEETYRREIALLKEELSIAKETIRNLLDQMTGDKWEPPIELNLTNKEALVFSVLYNNSGTVNRETIFTALNYFNADKIPDIKIIDVWICKIRKKIAPYGMTIDNVWGEGYRLTSDSKEIIKNWDNRE